MPMSLVTVQCPGRCCDSQAWDGFSYRLRSLVLSLEFLTGFHGACSPSVCRCVGKENIICLCVFRWVSQAEVCRSVLVGLEVLCASNSIHIVYSLLLGGPAVTSVLLQRFPPMRFLEVTRCFCLVVVLMNGGCSSADVPPCYTCSPCLQTCLVTDIHW